MYPNLNWINFDVHCALRTSLKIPLYLKYILYLSVSKQDPII